MKVSEILLNAAELADCGEEGACYYISCNFVDETEAQVFQRREALRLFEELLEQVAQFWWGYPLRYWNSPELGQNCSEEDHNARILGLLFAAEVAKDDEKASRKS